jgi:hypothetical protein
VTDLAERYGGPRRTRRRVTVAASAALAVAALAWLTWVMLDHGDPAVTSDLVSFDVVDQHTATATFTVVRRTPHVEASCLLRAQAPDHAVVGEQNLTIGPGGAEVTTLTEPIRTEREATSVSVVGCLAEGQQRRR